MMLEPAAGVAKSVDATDLKSVGGKPPCRFDPDHPHQSGKAVLAKPSGASVSVSLRHFPGSLPLFQIRGQEQYSPLIVQTYWDRSNVAAHRPDRTRRGSVRARKGGMVLLSPYSPLTFGEPSNVGIPSQARRRERVPGKV